MVDPLGHEGLAARPLEGSCLPRLQNLLLGLIDLFLRVLQFVLDLFLAVIPFEFRGERGGGAGAQGVELRVSSPAVPLLIEPGLSVGGSLSARASAAAFQAFSCASCRSFSAAATAASNSSFSCLPSSLAV